MRHRQVSGRAGGPCSGGPEFPAGGPLQIAPDVASSRAVMPEEIRVVGG